MKTDDLREAYLEFFESKGHVRRPSDVLVPKGDPTLLFTGAGMNQFKQQFLGIGTLEFTRATTCQKCIRTADIENVGRTPYHETFFEMLGNFSFGDYFKREAIQWAWEFLLDVLKIAPDRLSVTVYQDDNEAYDIWAKEIGVPTDRIERLDEDENFWPASAPSQGPNGVCGPCSEIYFHRGDESVEIWNLVFTQFDRKDGGVLDPLPNKNIDTGMGLERTAAVLQGVPTVYDTDIYEPVLAAMSDIVHQAYGTADAGVASRMRRIADHTRAVMFCIHENVFPSNEKQGYVVRRLLRRAVLDGYRMGVTDGFVHRLCPVIAESMKTPYPEVLEHVDRTANIVRLEEERFLETLEVGTRYLDDAIERLTRTGQRVLSGSDAFRLHDTYGFPHELTESILLERGMSIDRDQFESEMAAQRQRSRESTQIAGDIFVTGPVDELSKHVAPTQFLGYETTESAGVVRGLIADDQLAEQRAASDGEAPFAIVLGQTPFYGESGGQVGDRGVITGQDFEFQVEDTQKERDYILHIGRLTRGAVRVGDTVRSAVDAERRDAIRRAHSATHLLHYALRKALGRHAQQKGSRVDPDVLRFDFTHFQAITPEELDAIQHEVNRRVREAAPVTTEVMGLEEARQSGVTALFDEKYADTVRVVRMADFSAELCGGTHLANTGQAGLVKIVGEESIAAGTRRVTALTGEAALKAVLDADRVLAELGDVLKTPADGLVERVRSLSDEARRLRKEAAKGASAPVGPSAQDLLAGAETVGEVAVVAADMGKANPNQLRQTVDQLKREKGAVAVLIGVGEGKKVQLVAGLSKAALAQGLDAVDWVKTAAALVGGGGGGRPDMAQAGGKDAAKLADALKAGIEYVREKLG